MKIQAYAAALSYFFSSVNCGTIDDGAITVIPKRQYFKGLVGTRHEFSVFPDTFGYWPMVIRCGQGIQSPIYIEEEESMLVAAEAYYEPESRNSIDGGAWRGSYNTMGKWAHSEGFLEVLFHIEGENKFYDSSVFTPNGEHEKVHCWDQDKQ